MLAQYNAVIVCLVMHLSGRPSIYHTLVLCQMGKHGIMEIMPHNSPEILVF